MAQKRLTPALDPHLILHDTVDHLSVLYVPYTAHRVLLPVRILLRLWLRAPNWGVIFLKVFSIGPWFLGRAEYGID